MCTTKAAAKILISNDWIQKPFQLTGAHRRTGSTSVQKTFRLKQLFKHEQFSMRTLRNDIALLQLEGSISASPKVNTVCMPGSGSRPQAGARCYITGNWNVNPHNLFSPILISRRNENEPRTISCLYHAFNSSYFYPKSVGTMGLVRWIDFLKYIAHPTRLRLSKMEMN